MHPAFLYMPGGRLSVSELSAARLDGHVVELGEGYIPADLVEGAALRAQAIASLIPAGTAASGPTAAWVHAGGAPPPARHHVSRTSAQRLRIDVDRRVTFHDRRVEPAEVSLLSSVRVTTPARTMTDLLLGTRRGPDFLIWARLLADALPTAVEQAEQEIESLHRVPGRRQALEALAALGFRKT
ncbi:hypothetical protein ACI3KT_03130 [Microbacterium sp. ZW T6_19]|uniref:hypothetical protein n=1 Tax=Microbacterium sp. ZW T6_19 TaxID=3378082 RepID=UPI0038522752